MVQLAPSATQKVPLLSQVVPLGQGCDVQPEAERVSSCPARQRVVPTIAGAPPSAPAEAAQGTSVLPLQVAAQALQ